jgi:3-oxoadipate enol-lactonase/4-carboxymuconolactone decarboxylase
MSVWEHQMAALRPWFRLLRVEHPGHGGTGVPDGPGTVEALGRHLLLLLDRLGVGRAHVVGLSLGGLVGMWLAANHTNRVERLVLVSTTPRFNAPEAYRERAVAVRAHGTAHIAAAAMARWFTRPLAPASAMAVARYSAMLSGVDPHGYAYCCEAVADADLRAEVARISAPTLVMAGAQDPVVPPELAVAAATAIPGAALVVLPGGAHLVNVEQPAAFNDALVRHLAGSPEERGLAVRRAVLGDAHVDRALAATTPMTADFQQMLAKWPWGEVWARPGLDRRTRRMLTVAMLVALNRPEELEMHINAALGDGIGESDLKEVLLQAAAYAGVPAANAAFAIADRVVRRRTEQYQDVAPEPAG